MSDIQERKHLLQAKSYQYHNSTKHTLESLYSSNHRLEWSTQPNPFREYKGSSRLILPREIHSEQIDLFGLLKTMLALQSVHAVLSPYPVTSNSSKADLAFISNLLFYSMAISAWKQIKGTQDKWALRVNPSSGNLHPTETHLLVRGFDGIEDGAYHYFVKDHCLEKRANGNLVNEVWDQLNLPKEEAPPAILCLSSIFWREAWKYRDRAFRYCQLDMGHAAAAISLAAASFGWRCKVIAEFADKKIAELFGLLDSDEKPMLLIPLYSLNESGSHNQNENKAGITAEIHFVGTPNRLSSSEIHYDSIEEVYQAGCLAEDDLINRKIDLSVEARSIIGTADDAETTNLLSVYYQPVDSPPAHSIIRTRRSAVDMDGRMRISLARMSRILIDSSRGFDSSYSQTLPFEPCGKNLRFFVHIILYVHKVDGIAAGVYHFDRSSLELSCLNETNVRTFAKFASCMQDIASDGVFSVSLVADMQSAFAVFGERFYRYVHQEAGYIGQLFYLTARSLGIDATGIGCFIDDEINKSMPPGMEVVYNFTFGKAVLDSRLSDLPAYDFDDPSKTSELL